MRILVGLLVSLVELLMQAFDLKLELLYHGFVLLAFSD